MSAPSESALSAARVYRQVQHPGVVPVGGTWHVCADGTVWLRHESGNWLPSLFDADTITSSDDWEEAVG